MTNIIDINTKSVLTTEGYQTHLDSVVLEIRTLVAKGEVVNPYFIVDHFLDPEQNNRKIEDELVKFDLIAKGDFKKIIKKVQHAKKVVEALGAMPKDSRDYVALFAKKNRITVKFTGVLMKHSVVKLGDKVITEEDRKDKDLDAYYRVRANKTYSHENMKNDLKFTSVTLDLGYTSEHVQDAFDFWFSEERANRKFNMFDQLQYEKGVATGPTGDAMWEKVEEAAFNVQDNKGMAIAVLKKFMWQVKRKAMGLQVTNHMMPVITGKQGGGKSTLVTQMLESIADGVKNATFGDIADSKLIDLWETPVLFMDEMSGAKKADMNTVKQAITAATLTRRPMRTNTDVQVQQLSTFIGCSNDSVAEIIRDNTGIRRFVELNFKDQPNWEAMNEIDWLMLWKSVDPMANDPAIPFWDEIKEQQEQNRNQCPIELWLKENKGEYGKWTKTGQVFSQFTEWEQENFPGFNTNINTFGRRANTLISNQPDIGWEKETKAGVSMMRSL